MGSDGMGKRKRYCKDCKVLISDKRYYNFTTGLRCPDCQVDHKRELGRLRQIKHRFFGRELGSKVDKRTRAILLKYSMRHRMQMGYTVRVWNGVRYIFFYDVYFGEFTDPLNQIPKNKNTSKYIEHLIDEYGEENVKVLPRTREVH